MVSLFAKNQKIDVDKILMNIKQQIGIIEARQKLLAQAMVNLGREALAHKKNHNKQAALFVVRKRIMKKSEFNRLEGMKTLLSQQESSIEEKIPEIDIFRTLKEANTALGAMGKETTLEGFEELQANFEESMEKRGEINDLFVEMAEKDMDEMMQEIDNIEKEDEELLKRGMANVPSKCMLWMLW
eukprot:TRINITY_DN9457_c0_g1_i2.p1 TRINITY_DN9457_c0_g1~~TRINITY_DN9457_c0_g1_i2.p1  ORF type:complete len:185 (-),score=75.00 TRINITY_DN9457_c0_g1_i2:273-827(-)